jgi:hypothetical protein
MACRRPHHPGFSVEPEQWHRNHSPFLRAVVGPRPARVHPSLPSLPTAAPHRWRPVPPRLEAVRLRPEYSAHRPASPLGAKPRLPSDAQARPTAVATAVIRYPAVMDLDQAERAAPSTMRTRSSAPASRIHTSFQLPSLRIHFRLLYR